MKDLALAELAAHMRELISTPSWAIYRDQMERNVSSRMEQLVSINHDDVPFIQGWVQAMRTMINFPEQIIRRSKT